MSKLAFWIVVGFLGQALFTARFLVQWVSSERERNSVVPAAFWWLSIFGGTALFCYALFRRDPVIVSGQALGLLVYVRNLMLMTGAKRRAVRNGVQPVRVAVSNSRNCMSELDPSGVATVAHS